MRSVARLALAFVALGVATARADAPEIGDAVAAGQEWRIDTPHGAVHVWAPAGYDPATAETIVYVHGYWTTVDEAWIDHRLPEQFAMSGLNALFIACEAPSDKHEPVAWRSLRGLLAAVAGAQIPMPNGRLVAVGHSGAYRTLIPWLANPRLDTVVLIDAAYEPDPFRAWVRATRRHRLIDIGEDTLRWTEPLHRSLPSTVVLDDIPPPEAGELPPEAAAARVVYIRSTIGHMPLVTGGVALPMVLRALSSEPLPDDALPLGLTPTTEEPDTIASTEPDE
ncbi:MAG TPA: hypothetical protein VL463_15555 [Kofleriaceae bacterium]|jgi:hypothetical protein|nr:hypothetical protein [Kofleriaceae bacterium]